MYHQNASMLGEPCLFIIMHAQLLSQLHNPLILTLRCFNMYPKTKQNKNRKKYFMNLLTTQFCLRLRFNLYHKKVSGKNTQSQ